MRALAPNRLRHGQSAVDVATPVHFALGVLAGLLGISPVKAALVLTVAKVGIAAAEKGLGHALFSRRKGESNLNELCDLLAEIAGVDVGAQIRARRVPQPALPAAGVGRVLR